MASADAHDLEIRHVTDSAATGLVQTVVAVDVVINEIDGGGCAVCGVWAQLLPCCVAVP